MVFLRVNLFFSIFLFIILFLVGLFSVEIYSTRIIDHNKYLMSIFGISIFILLFFVRKCNVTDNSVKSMQATDIDMKNLRSCKRCNRLKPERSHHCSTCRKCIKKMDHHCIWLNNCIGNDNLAYFIRLCFFGSSISIFCFFYSIYLFSHEEFFDSFFVSCSIRISVMFFFILSCLLTYFFIFHFKGILKNLTFLERENVREILEKGFSCDESPYDLGVFANLDTLMGKFYFLYFYGESSNGITFKKKYYIKEWPPYRHGSLLNMY